MSDQEIIKQNYDKDSNTFDLTKIQFKLNIKIAIYLISLVGSLCWITVMGTTWVNKLTQTVKSNSDEWHNELKIERSRADSLFNYHQYLITNHESRIKTCEDNNDLFIDKVIKRLK